MAFDVLMREQSVSRAAERMYITQSAMSHTLNRLRQLFDDPLLVRTSSGMKPTPRALALVDPLQKALQEIDRLINSPPTFDAKTSQRRFFIAATDYVEYLIIPSLIGYMTRLAPGVDVYVDHPNLRSLEKDLENGDLDVALGFDVILNTPKHLCSERLFDERMACMVRKDHPCVGEEISLEQYISLKHLLVSTSPKQTGIVDEWLAERGLDRRVALKIPHFLTAPFILAESDMVLSVPQRMAEQFVHLAPLKMVPPPIDLPNNQVVMVWHPLDDKEPSCTWLREQLKVVSKATAKELL